MLGAVFLCNYRSRSSLFRSWPLRNEKHKGIMDFCENFTCPELFGTVCMDNGKRSTSNGINPFYGIMPGWFLIPGIFISTAAAIIASQALITGSYTLISEAISLNFWPKVKVLNPTFLKGQVYVPYVNWFLWVACSFVVIFFRESSNMEAAYGLSITMTMIMTTLLLSYYLYQKGVYHRLIILLIIVFLTIEGSFLIANLHKFNNGGWFTSAAGISIFCDHVWLVLRQKAEKQICNIYKA